MQRTSNEILPKGIPNRKPNANVRKRKMLKGKDVNDTMKS